jgi:hypothetical protein
VPLSSFWTSESVVEVLYRWTVTRMYCWIVTMFMFSDWEPFAEKFLDELMPDFAEGDDYSDMALPVYVQDGYIGKLVSLLCILHDFCFCP